MADPTEYLRGDEQAGTGRGEHFLGQQRRPRDEKREQQEKEQGPADREGPAFPAGDRDGDGEQNGDDQGLNELDAAERTPRAGKL